MHAESRTRRLVAVLAALVLGAIAFAPLSAGPAAAATPEWVRIPCSEGAIDQATLDRSKEEGELFLTLAGHLDCADPKQSGAAFAYAVYQENLAFAALYTSNLRQYAAAGQSLFADRKRVTTNTLTVCVVTDVDVRVACVEMYFDQLDHRYVVRPLATDDPLVQRPVQATPSEGGPRPVCGHCW
jgi:hypothetical protein